MKQYHTAIVINASAKAVWQELTNFKAYPDWNPIVGKLEGEMKEGSTISTHIVPLKNTYFPVLTRYDETRELVWKGAQGASFLLAAEHYYRLNELSENQVELQHGEYFTGIISYLLPKNLLANMHAAFEQHNSLLKQRIEKGE